MMAKSQIEAQKLAIEIENHPQYLKYQRLLDQYFEISNNNEKRERKFLELIEQSQKLENLGLKFNGVVN